MLWLTFALMTGAAVFAVLWPLSRRTVAAAGTDAAVYRDQLDEIGRDRAAGLIGGPEAEAARIEVSRRLLAAADADAAATPAEPGTPLLRRRTAALVALIVLPVAAAATYLALGSPQLPGEPLAMRQRTPQEQRSIAGLVSQVESHIEKNPSDGRGWEVIAPVYLRMGRFDDAVKARRNALALNGETAERQSDLGEALVMAANGIVTADAKRAFDRAVELDGQHFKARFFVGLAAEQDGRKAEAIATWRALVTDSPADAPWIQTVREALARAGSLLDAAQPQAAAPGPGADDIAAAGKMTETDRGEMIRGMVARLAARLAQDGSDIDGWLRLMQAYMVLGDHGKATAAAGDARRALAGDPAKLRRIDELASRLGIKG